MKAGLKKAARVVIFLLIGLLLLWVSFRGIDFRQLGKALADARYGWLIISVTVAVAAMFIRARRWILLIEPMGYKPSLGVTYHALLTGYFANLIFPRLGEITRCAALGRKENIPFDRLVGTMLVERTIDILTVFVLLTLTVLSGSTSTGSFLSNNVVSPMVAKINSLFGSVNLLIIILLLLTAIIIALFFMMRKKLAGMAFFSKVYSFADGIVHGLKAIASLKGKWEFVLLTVLMWTAYLFMSFFPLLCLESTKDLGLGGALFILVTGSFGMAVPVQSGIGAYHWIVSRGLLFVYGIPLEEGLAYATLSHESQLVMIALLGAVSLFILFGRRSGEILSETASGNA